MKRVSILVIALLVANSHIAKANINQDFQHILNGSVPLTDNSIDELYQLFQAQFKVEKGQLPSHKMRLSSTLIDRKRIFQEKLISIIEHNQNPDYHFKKGINQFSDMTFDEFKLMYNLYPQDGCFWPYVDGQPAINQQQSLKDISNELPTHWDWRSYGVISPIKNQGECGSCWAHSTVAALEARYKMRYGGDFLDLSEQQLVDCAWDYDTHGCDGGLPSNAYTYLNENGGITTEQQYPYKGIDEKCYLEDSMKIVGVRGGSVNLTQSEDDLRVALYQTGPVSVLYQWVDDFTDYKSGVYHSTNCKSDADSVNHAVIVVGWGTEDGMDYWICKNSYGVSWGDQGYFKIQRGVNMCGINNCSSYPLEVYDLKKDLLFFMK